MFLQFLTFLKLTDELMKQLLCFLCNYRITKLLQQILEDLYKIELQLTFN